MITFIDLFAGIGGTRLGFERAGATCIASCEIDKYARQTYEANFSPVEYNDIRDIESLPYADVILAGFPCPTFSSAGVSKLRSMGLPDGFADLTRGTLFFEIIRLAKDMQPKIILLENVRNLTKHNKGQTFEIILRALDEIGYTTHAHIINADKWVPQSRERVYLVAMRKDLKCYHPNPQMWTLNQPKLENILEANVAPKYTLSDRLIGTLERHAARHKERGNRFTYTIADLSGPSRTLTARYGKDGSEILIPQEGKNPRRLTPRECARLMGFPDDFIIPVSDTQAYKQFGNSVVVPVIEQFAAAIIRELSVTI